MLLLHFFFSLSLLYLIVPVVILSSILAWGSFNINSQFYVKTVCSAPDNKNEIAITLDDGPDGKYSPAVLEILKKHNITATFFCIGEKAASNPELILQLKEAGHIIGNHTYSHSRWIDFFSAKKLAMEFERTNESILQITGEEPVYFRPPYGVTTPPMYRALKKFNMVAVGWSLRSLDTVIRSKDKILNKIIRKVRSGDIVLFHDILPGSGILIDAFITAVKAKGIKIVALDHLLNQNKHE
jgi:peptidoglycan/xylan/chitin deacetylase (PgdA/CDA1 family)